MRCGRGWCLSPCVSNGKGAELQIRGMWSAGAGDDQARFLADLRALRDLAAIGYDELSARAHYPSDVLKEAENGPLLPGLPVLTAYVRACEGDVLDWEERWRRLAEVPADPDLPVRPAGASPAAAAGARAGVSVAPPEVYDPERIRAALRGSQGRSEHSGRRTSDPAISAPTRGYEFPDRSPAGWGVGTSQDGTGANLDPGANLERLARPGIPARAGTRRPTRPSRWPTATTLPTTRTGGHSTPQSSRCLIRPSVRSKTISSTGYPTAHRHRGRPTANSPGLTSQAQGRSAPTRRTWGRRAPGRRQRHRTSTPCRLSRPLANGRRRRRTTYLSRRSGRISGRPR